MIGLGKTQEGIYTLQSNSSALLPASVSDFLAKLSRFSFFCFNSCIFEVDKSSLWHCRLGHPSPTKFSLVAITCTKCHYMQY